MCAICDQIDNRIARYKWIKEQITDRLALDAISRLIAGLEQQKAALHPDQE
jgi:hypothetical protein